jgi:hypothetical protein
MYFVQPKRKNPILLQDIYIFLCSCQSIWQLVASSTLFQDMLSNTQIALTLLCFVVDNRAMFFKAPAAPIYSTFVFILPYR